ncbi:universal stress protein [Planococcus sp. NCCP-2050]|uniref:universal stress protein n=1 Tax=Planococcus sp. NCCP-2050 TaxID=2944679 RepID=UPI00203EA727|nr:universal stress protein [Planococcus sp. NCCP-2050]GKW47754.1 universal stress protein UspA [Planococcus sp. NCCP-2050]
MYQNLAVAYDGSDGSKIALDKALEIKKSFPESKLNVIYVNEQVKENIGFMEAGGASAPVVSANVDSNYAQFMPPEIGDDGYRVPSDYADDSIEFSKHMHNAIQQKIDLLIIGNSGKSGLQKFFVGSVSKKLLKEAPCSVLVVK